jgi:nucleoside-diphosphate-sugar epimerase
MTVLITGIHGFVGSNLVESLRHHTVYGLDIVSPRRENIVRTYSWEDLDDLPAVDAVVHLAGKAHDVRKKAEAAEYFRVNTGLTKKIFDWFLKSSAGKFVFFSSVKAAADTANAILTEDMVPVSVGPYGESKLAAERYLQERLAVSSWRPEKKVYILRPCMIHGPGNRGNLNLLYGVVKRGIPWPLGSFENRRSFTSIDNLIFIVKSLLADDIEGGVYHIADDEALSTNELVAIICEACSRKCRIWKINKNLVDAAAWMGGILHLPLNRDRLKRLTEDYVVSNRKIKAALSIDSLPVTARAGIIKTVKSFEVL